MSKNDVPVSKSVRDSSTTCFDAFRRFHISTATLLKKTDSFLTFTPFNEEDSTFYVISSFLERETGILYSQLASRQSGAIDALSLVTIPTRPFGDSNGQSTLLRCELFPLFSMKNGTLFL